MEYLKNTIEWLQTFLSSTLHPEELEPKLFQSLVIIFFLWVFRLVVIRVVHYETEDVRTRYRWGKVSTYLTVILGVILVGRIWIGGVESLATFLGLVSAGVAIALQGPITDLAGWAFLLWRRPFEVGDRVQIGEHAGDVIDMRILKFTLLEIGNWVDADQSTGRIIHVPNRRVFNDVVANYSQGFEHIWNEIPVLITFESDWEKAKAILQEIADRRAGDIAQTVAGQVKQAARRFMIMYSTLTPTVYTRVEASGVLLTIRYLCEVRRRRSTEQDIWEDILRAFAQHPDVNLAYPTQRFYYVLSEDKPKIEKGQTEPGHTGDTTGPPVQVISESGR